MSLGKGAVLVLLLAAAAACQAQLSTEDNLDDIATDLRVVEPPEEAHFIVHSSALIGTPNYGGTLRGQLFYTNSSGCEPIPANQGWPRGPWTAPFILLLNRGGCSFTTKMRNVQATGAAAALKANNVPGYLLPHMVDDGTGVDVSIPAAMITQEEGERLKACLRGINCTSDYMEVQFEWPANKLVQVEQALWTTVFYDPIGEQLKTAWRGVYNHMGENLDFRPRYFFLDGRNYNCTDEGNPCGSQCTNGGRYCMPDPENDLDAGISGRDVIREGLNQLCLWRHLETIRDNTLASKLKWFSYVRRFDLVCRGDDFNWACSRSQLIRLSIDFTAVEECVSNSGGVDTDADNSILAAEMDEARNSFIQWVPNVVNNDIISRGLPSADNMLRSTCASYIPGAVPPMCRCMDQAATFAGPGELLALAVLNCSTCPTYQNLICGGWGICNKVEESCDCDEGHSGVACQTVDIPLDTPYFPDEEDEPQPAGSLVGLWVALTFAIIGAIAYAAYRITRRRGGASAASAGAAGAASAGAPAAAAEEGAARDYGKGDFGVIDASGISMTEMTVEEEGGDGGDGDDGADDDEGDLPPGWEEVHNDDGAFAYYRHVETGKTQWSKPSA